MKVSHKNILDTDSLQQLTAFEVADLIKKRQLSATQLISVLSDRIEKNTSLNAYITFDKTRAIREAKIIDEKIKNGETSGLLLGVPIVVKDNIEVAGLPNTAGTPFLKNYIPQKNAPIIQALVEEGAIIIGKANMHELSFGITSNNKHFGAVGNPYRRDYFAGGSSGGTATAVAYFMATAGIGADTGGSVRIPASFTGIYGFRPTKGKYATENATPISNTRDTPGPMTRSVRYLILLDAVVMKTIPDYNAIEAKEIRLGVPRKHFYEGMDAELTPVVESALEKLKQAGVTLVEADLPDLPVAFGGPMTFYEARRELQKYLEKIVGTSLDINKFVNEIASPDVHKAMEAIFLNNEVPSTEEYQKFIQEDRPKLQAVYQAYFETQQVDAIIFPTVKVTAQPINGTINHISLNDELVPTFPTIVHNTNPGSLAGIPGITLPIGLSKSGLPIGIEIDGLANDDKKLLQIGLSLEEIFGRIPLPKL